MGIPIGRYIGDLARDVLPHGDIVVDAVDKGIEIVKKTDLSLPHEISNAGQAAIDAAKARVREDIAQALRESSQRTINFAGIGGNNSLILVLLGIGVVILLMKGRK